MMFHEIKVRQNGEEKWVDARKWFDYMCKEYSQVKYDGKKIEPYADRVNKFFDNIPEDLIKMWSKAYPNVDVKMECEKSRAWLLTNTNKAKKDFKGFTNRWLARACQNGGQIPVDTEKKLDEHIRRQNRYRKEAEERANINPASQDDIQKILKEGGWKK